MYNTDGNIHRLCIRDNLLNCWQPHQHIYLKGKKQVLQCIKNAFCEKKLPLIENYKIFKLF